MPDSDVAFLFSQTFWVILKLSAPPLLAAMAAGLVMSLLQAVTQINEQTLSFVPKAAAVVAVLSIGGPFMWSGLFDFSHLVFDRMVAAGGW
jgi:flagellar biosynthetic protein FliQ